LPGFVSTGAEFTGMTVNILPLLAVPPTVTTTFPVLAPLGTGTAMLDDAQLVGVADIPLNVTVLAPFVDPKFDPLIMTDTPGAPLDGDSVTIDGDAGEEGTETGTSAENGLNAPFVLYARTAKKYVAPSATVTTALVTLPTSIVVVYEPLVVPYESL
jgi:hypothetical protein